ncbi:MAG: GNAT family N-acetyltransferase [Roseiflexaceae bacterium]|nr:GNAT family N-acetyltransferase [Roseiflexaceae bacterium]
MTIISRKVVPLDAPHVAAPARVAARAFADDPMFTYIFPDSALRPKLLGRFMTAALRYGSLFGTVSTTTDNAGSAIWLVPNQTTVTPVRMLRSGMAALPVTIGVAAFRRFLQVVDYGDRVHSEIVREPHWYLLNLAVDPPRQRQGIASALIAPVLARADRDQQPCYLETNNPSNLPFYTKHGFEVAHTGQVPNNGPALWAMLRRPQAS